MKQILKSVSPKEPISPLIHVTITPTNRYKLFYTTKRDSIKKIKEQTGNNPNIKYYKLVDFTMPQLMLIQQLIKEAKR